VTRPRWRTQTPIEAPPTTDESSAQALTRAGKAFTGWLGWLGASVAGLTALCYGAGYFVIHTHLTMLGLSGVIDVPTNQLLLEGGRFFFFTLSQMVVFAMVLAAIAIAVWIIATTVSRIPPVRKGAAAVVTRFRLNERVKAITPYLMAVLITGTVILLSYLYYDDLSSLLQLHNLAFGPSEPKCNTLAATVQPLIMSGSGAARDSLIQTYTFLVWKYSAFIIFVLFIVYGNPKVFLGKFAKSLLVLLAVLMTAVLPASFAVLVRTPIYPVANLTFKNGQQSRGLLLQRTDHNVLVWDRGRLAAVSYNADDLSSVEVIGERDIFQKE
jgi:hypothetical protein